MRRAAHQDSTHPAIVAALRAVGASVYRISSPEAGLPDLIVGHRRRTYLLEVKTGNGELRDVQVTWHRCWCGHPVSVVRTPEEALAAIGLKVSIE